MSNLFPTFAVPKVVEKEMQKENRTKKSLYFDFEKGDIAWLCAWSGMVSGGL